MQAQRRACAKALGAKDESTVFEELKGASVAVENRLKKTERDEAVEVGKNQIIEGFVSRDKGFNFIIRVMGSHKRVL